MKIVITVEGGLVQSIVADTDFEAVVLDLDTEGSDTETITAQDGEAAEVIYRDHAERWSPLSVDPHWVDQVFRKE